MSTVNTELILADLQTLEKSKIKDKVANLAIEKATQGLNEGKLARDLSLTSEELEIIKPLQLLTAKPMFYVANVSEDQLNDSLPEGFIPISAKVEAELASLSEDEQDEYLRELGVSESGLDKVIHKGYEILNLISFLTAGVKEVRAWTIKKGANAQSAAGVIHTDFVKKFIKAEVIQFEDFVSSGGWKRARELGKTRLEGRDYIIKDGDVVEFKIGT
jgi:ribosome-binding ATPase YchF (GTP1/OBG family)